MTNKEIGNKEILSKYQQSRYRLEPFKKRLSNKCDTEMKAIQKLAKYDKNEANEKRLNEAMGRIVKFKNELFLAWKKNLDSDFLDDK
ncbi:hypothetical protein KAT36_00320 [Candidatus Pacearchaeota archaeon]|nr:hypothetical protein [Candidatus Pacearchaeota archaeon]